MGIVALPAALGWLNEERRPKGQRNPQCSVCAERFRDSDQSPVFVVAIAVGVTSTMLGLMSTFVVSRSRSIPQIVVLLVSIKQMAVTHAPRHENVQEANAEVLSYNGAEIPVRVGSHKRVHDHQCTQKICRISTQELLSTCKLPIRICTEGAGNIMLQ